jgi:tRNA (guanine-N7-)-methyltransferase
MPETERKRRLLYGRRKGPKLSPRQQRLRDTLLPQLLLKPEAGRDPKSYFADVDDVWLEVGFGAGEHLLWQAEHHPRVGVIGAEPYEAGTNKLLSKLALNFSSPVVTGEVSPGAPQERRETEGEIPPNIRLYEGDARDILDALPEKSLGRFFILFPDPWPKTRHHKRRFIQTAMLDTLARLLKPGAELRFATDDKSYLPYALERLMAHPAFVWTANGQNDWKTRPSDWPQTRYEAKAIKGPPVFLSFRRREG